jgi:hypothetical protein
VVNLGVQNPWPAGAAALQSRLNSRGAARVRIWLDVQPTGRAERISAQFVSG